MWFSSPGVALPATDFKRPYWYEGREPTRSFYEYDLSFIDPFRTQNVNGDRRRTQFCAIGFENLDDVAFSTEGAGPHEPVSSSGQNISRDLGGLVERELGGLTGPDSCARATDCVSVVAGTKPRMTAVFQVFISSFPQ
jgi:hypothetical protein